MALVRERTIPTERPPPVGEVSANFIPYHKRQTPYGFRILSETLAVFALRKADRPLLVTSNRGFYIQKHKFDVILTVHRR